MIKISATALMRPLKSAFRIARGDKTEAHCLIVTLEHQGRIGRAEAVPYARYGETMEGAIQALKSLDCVFLGEDVREILPAGAARNALDCALWDLKAQLQDKSVADMLGVEPPANLRTAQTLSLDTPENMQNAARELSDHALIKIKLGGGDEDVSRLKAIRDARPEANLIVDANEGWSVEDYEHMIPICLDLGVEMIEQPFPADADGVLADLPRPILICADESAHSSGDVKSLLGRYDMINIKLDKTGGLTDALDMVAVANVNKMPYMVGCMVGSSLSMAPAYLLTSHAKYVDLDGPLFLEEDEEPAIEYVDGMMQRPSSKLWGLM